MSKVVAIFALSSLCAGTAAYANNWKAASQVGWAARPVSAQSSPMAAPEIDPAGAMAGLTLLVGGLAVLRGRHLKK